MVSKTYVQIVWDYPFKRQAQLNYISRKIMHRFSAVHSTSTLTKTPKFLQPWKLMWKFSQKWKLLGKFSWNKKCCKKFHGNENFCKIEHCYKNKNFAKTLIKICLFHFWNSGWINKEGMNLNLQKQTTPQ
jgi:hypothetical protein